MTARITHKYLVEFDEHGEINFCNPKHKKIYLDKCQKMKGKSAYLVIQPIRKIKTNEQNKYYWGVVIQRLREYFGESSKDMHESLSHEFLVFRNEKGILERRSTSLDEWSTIEWEDYMSKVRQWASSLHGIYIELPNEVDYSSLPKTYY